VDQSFTFGTIVYLFVALLVIVTLTRTVKIVPQSENWLVERIGKYNRTLGAGLHLIIPFFESISALHKISIQEVQLPTDRIAAITKDNVTISIKLAILYRIVDVSRTVYRIQNVKSAVETVVIGAIRNVIGQTDLDGVQTNRQHLAAVIEEQLQHVANEWGIKLTRVEIIEVDVDPATKEAMQIQLNAERMRRGSVTEAEGKKQALQLKADAELYTAQRVAEATRLRADAQAYALEVVSKAISAGGNSAVEFEIRKIQAAAVQELSKSSNSKIIMLPTDVLSSLTSTIARISDKF
jgi:regulator of protease activity HflC (stomatin/prohibitin superfamily)